MTSSTSVWLNGCNGRMGGQVAAAIAADPGFHLIAGLSREGIHSFAADAGFTLADDSKQKAQLLAAAQLFIDFSLPEASMALADLMADAPAGKAIVVATTGLSVDQLKVWQDLGQAHKVLIAPNTSLGVAASYQLARQLAQSLGRDSFDVEIVETHHRHKKDAPSGTALFLAEAVCEDGQRRPVTDRSGERQVGEVGVAALRGGSVFGEHEVRFLSQHEEVTISHRAFDRGLFSAGSLALSRWLLARPQGFYHLRDIPLSELKS